MPALVVLAVQGLALAWVVQVVLPVAVVTLGP